MTWPQFLVHSYLRIGYTAIMGIGTMHSGAMKTCHAAPATVPGAGRGLKLLDRLREGRRTSHYSRRAGQTYIMWVRRPESWRERVQEPSRRALRGSGRRVMRKPYKAHDISRSCRNMLSRQDLGALSACVLCGDVRRSASYTETT